MSGATEEKADLAAWLAVAAGTIGSLMATLDTSIVNSSLPTIQGEIGASGTEGTWIATAYLVAEIVMIPLAGWLQRILGLRNLLLIATIFFTIFSVFCGLSTTLVQMIIGRVGQGFTGGAMIPTALTIVATRLPESQRPVGIALFGMTAVMGPVVGPVLGGWLTENFSWHYNFFINVPIGLGLVVLLFVGLPHQAARWRDFLGTDLLGLAGLVFGLGCLTVLLEEGQRERWFESEMIIWLAVVSVLGFASLVAGQYVARRPIIDLSILLKRAFFGVFFVSLVLGAALYGLLYLIPQFLFAVPGYNSLQAGQIAAISGIPTIVMLALFPILVRHLNMRAAVIFGLVLFATSCFMDSGLTADSVGGDMVASQVIRGFAQFFSMLFLNQAVASAVPREQADAASGLYNVARNLGGSLGLAAVSTLQDQREALHLDRLAESITANSLRGQEAMQTLGVNGIVQAIQEQALVMTYNDLFMLFGVVLLGIIPLVFLLRTPKHAGEAGMHP